MDRASRALWVSTPFPSSFGIVALAPIASARSTELARLESDGSLWWQTRTTAARPDAAALSIEQASWTSTTGSLRSPRKPSATMITRQRCRYLATVVVLVLGVPSTAHATNDAIRWNSVLLEAVRTTAFPPMHAARAFAIVHTCMYDAWAVRRKSSPGIC